MGSQQGKYKPSQYASLRAEAFCAALLDNGAFFEDFVIQYAGAFRRTFRNDINSIKLTGDERLELELNRDGIYDKLPEGLFHQSLGSGRTSSLQDMVGEHRRYKEEERSARKFFQPLEQEMFRYGVIAEQEERSILFSMLSGQASPAFFSFWNIDADLPEEPAKMLIRLMPLQQRIKGDKELTAKALSLLLNKPVQVKETLVQEQQAAQAQAFLPGQDCLLGVNTIMGHRFAEPGLRWEFTISEVDRHEMPAFTEDQPFDRLLRRFTEIFIPIDTEEVFHFRLAEITGENEPADYIMGYGFYL